MIDIKEKVAIFNVFVVNKMSNSKETGAITLLKRAVELDSKKQWTSALVCYKEGLQLLMEAIRTGEFRPFKTKESPLNSQFSESMDGGKKAKFREKANEYMNRAEQLQKIIDNAKKSGDFHEHIEIQADSVGHSYESLFGRFLDCDVISIHIEDPYIRAHHQIVNLFRFCELVIRKCSNINKIHLVTGQDSNQVQEQISKLRELATELQQNHKIALTFEFSTTLHDRLIKLSSGWIIKLGRGLDIYKNSKSKWSPGYFDMDLRPCLQTSIDIYHGTIK